MTLAALKERIHNQRSISDTVKAVVFCLGPTSVPKSPSGWHCAFHRLKSIFPALFDDLIFDQSGITPFSDELYDILFSLEMSAILATQNPTYEYYTITEAIHAELKESFDKFNDGERQLLKDCAKFLEKELAAL